MTRYRDRYDDIYHQLSRADLQKGSLGLEELSAGPELFGHDTERWLGFYTDRGLETALEQYGFTQDLDELGFHQLRIETDTDDPDRHQLRVWSTEPKVGEPLVELVVRRDFMRPRSEFADRIPASHIPVLTVDWLLLQNPRATFDADRPPLPGQRHPGLGVGAQVLEMLRNVCRRLDLAGLANVPSYFHNALFYSTDFRHFDPRWQGAFLALCRDLLSGTRLSVTAASWAMYWELIENRADDGAPFCWFQELMLAPVSDLLHTYFDNELYRRDVQRHLQSHEFSIRRPALREKLASRGIEPFDADKIEAWIAD